MRIIIVSDVHGDADTLDRILVKERNWDLFIFAGDAVGRGEEPNEVVETLRGIENLVAVLGNWDYAVVRGKVDMARKSEDADNVLWTRSVLREENLRWLQMLPLVREVNADGKKITVVHGTPDVMLYGYIYPWTEKSIVRAYLKDTDVLITGHTHVPHVFEWNTKKWGRRIYVNPGSPTFPASGAKKTYAVLDTEKWVVKIRTLNL